MKDLRKPAKQAYPGDEQKFQREAAEWLKKELYLRGLPNIFYHVANERKTTPQAAMRLKMQGVLSGVSDVVLPIKAGEYSGIYCELKAKTGSPSPEQKEFLTGVASEGFLAVIINDMETFKEVFTYYLDQRKQTPWFIS